MSKEAKVPERERSASALRTSRSEMSKEAKVPERERSASALRTSHNERSSRAEDEDEPLLCGLLNDIVLHQIVPKLPWRAFHILSSVSRPWRRAIKKRLVYDARVCSQSIETLVVLNRHNQSIFEKDNEISLYSPRDFSWYRLPLFPKSRICQRGIPTFGQCVSLDGKIYILGGCMDSADPDDNYDRDGSGLVESSEVYVLDLAGQMEWTRCADMPQPRFAFGSGISDGKIYVFGGSYHREPIRESVVYDPKENAWSSIAPMKHSRADHHVVTVGEELFVHGGRVCEPGHKIPFLTEVYQAVKDEWRLLGPFGCHESETLFTAQGELYMLTPLGIYVHGINSDESQFWQLQHEFSIELDVERFDEIVVEAVGDELLVSLTRQHHTFLFETGGFGCRRVIDLQNKVVGQAGQGYPFLMCSIQL